MIKEQKRGIHIDIDRDICKVDVEYVVMKRMGCFGELSRPSNKMEIKMCHVCVCVFGVKDRVGGRNG